ncbi:uncharacterized protein N7483_010184 [Penicillium malachiteum]|uniref:uncharacterized protein n=1 Tax=Penicillium malachiteum TaxID=1324776 RepID=UPI002547900C|nr:uncharacterized protein N7483_010184 [Penicillium malachiteum]KAJ5713003.1 hypothetical protein N7483_010184 [Penicillium malachiteum]
MAPDPRYKLSDEQIAHFMQYGYVRVPECFSREKAAAWTADVWTRLGFSPTDKATWTTECTHMPEHKEEPVKTFAPKAWAAICELLGGKHRIDPDSATWNDAFIVNLGTPEMEGKWPHPSELEGWHVDGDFFIHFLDSPEQGLLVIPLFNDIQEHGGGTMICTESVKHVARFLVRDILFDHFGSSACLFLLLRAIANTIISKYDNPRGVSPYMVPRGFKFRKPTVDFYDSILEKCTEFHEMTGSVGDVILLHPLMVHSQSVNSLRIPRIITNPPVSLKKPFNFDRKDPGRFSIVERKTLQDLGTDRLRGWKIKGGRELVVPERVKEHEEMKEQELGRLNV